MDAQRKFELLYKDTQLVQSEWARIFSRPELRHYGRESYFYLFMKRMIDVVLSSMALIVLLPFLLVVTLIVYLDDPHGNPIFVQERVGKNGVFFHIKISQHDSRSR